MKSTETAHLDSYFDSVFSSQAVFPPPKFFLAVSAKPYKQKAPEITQGLFLTKIKGNNKCLYKICGKCHVETTLEPSSCWSNSWVKATANDKHEKWESVGYSTTWLNFPNTWARLCYSLGLQNPPCIYETLHLSPPSSQEVYYYHLNRTSTSFSCDNSPTCTTL